MYYTITEFKNNGDWKVYKKKSKNCLDIISKKHKIINESQIFIKVIYHESHDTEYSKFFNYGKVKFHNHQNIRQIIFGEEDITEEWKKKVDNL